ncbi:hypothetical protein C0J52_14673 [Blattella germanica]|nr:hypothetical protein C0J52_14673 [Blattella germanica]
MQLRCEIFVVNNLLCMNAFKFKFCCISLSCLSRNNYLHLEISALQICLVSFKV